ncbi:MAG: glycosyltransferase family 9 protein [Candidatus Omnitrophica bacterium]|nr:glycosyltransferase family 9 protein [Candidatus Omnitrophota bacterium]
MQEPSKILVTRTDRIGDVLLSTPVIKSLRMRFPQSHITMLVRPYTRDIVIGNPYLSEVLIYDKYGKESSLWRSLLFALGLRKKKFDVALMLHPTNRVHLMAFIAGIKRRIGFNKKLGFLLTEKIEHKKQEGKKHELEYTLDLLRVFGKGAEDCSLFMPIREDSEIYIEDLLSSKGWRKNEKIIAIHPSASCPSKVWPTERFANIAKKIALEFKVKIAVVSGPDDVDIGRRLIKLSDIPFMDLAGKTTVSQLASLFRRCSLFISNDSGPIHIAAAVGTPVISIFGRRQPGLSPCRWGPKGKGDIVLHKDLGCVPCLAHNCQRGFACLKAISEEEVLSAARKILRTYSIDS